MKLEELKTAKFLLDRLCRDYPTMFDEDGHRKYFYSGREADTSPTIVKDDIRLIRRLLMEVSKEL